MVSRVRLSAICRRLHLLPKSDTLRTRRGNGMMLVHEIHGAGWICRAVNFENRNEFGVDEEHSRRIHRFSRF